jgi:hypothetical protein
VAIADVGTGAGCGLAKGCWELDEAVISDAMMNAVYTNLRVANIGGIPICPATKLLSGPRGPDKVDGSSQAGVLTRKVLRLISVS